MKLAEERSVETHARAPSGLPQRLQNLADGSRCAAPQFSQAAPRLRSAPQVPQKAAPDVFVAPHVPQLPGTGGT